MKTLIFTLSILFINSIGYSNVNDAHEILYPGVLNGEKYLTNQSGQTSGNEKFYCNLVMNCIYVHGGCTVQDAKDYYLSTSSADGICKNHGFNKAVSSSFTNQLNPFGQFRTIDEAGNLIDISNQKIKQLRSNNFKCQEKDPAGRTFVYFSKKPSKIYSSVTCN